MVNIPYKPKQISDFKTGLIQEQEDYLIPDDGFTQLRNAYAWRQAVIKKQGLEFVGRFRRVFINEDIPGGALASPWNFNLFTTFTLAGISPSIELGSVTITIGGIILTDQRDGTLTSPTPGNSGTINYATGAISITHTGGAVPATISHAYFPSFPAMGIRTKEEDATNEEKTIGFDTMFAYQFTGGWEELPTATPTTWSGTDSDFFWTTNFWVNASNQKLFWATNFVNSAGNEMRYYDGSTWTVFTPTISIIGPVTTLLLQAQMLIPFRGRMVALQTIEGDVIGSGTQYFQRIRWAAIGNPTGADTWRDDIRGKGSYLDVPTSQKIVSAGFVRDNLIIYCERSTWQLLYTGNTIQPFQLERVNSELGVESTFSGVQFDTSIVGIGDKGIIECDSFSSTRIDDKITDFVYGINNLEGGKKRIHGYRNFKKRLAYWSYPDVLSTKFPNKRLVFNYDNLSWAIFDDSITCLGTFQPSGSRTWQEDVTWEEANFTWRDQQALFPEVMGGNQRGFTFYLDSLSNNEISLPIDGITGNDTLSTTITCTDHNLSTGTVIEVDGVISPGEFDTLNGKRFKIDVIDDNTFDLNIYDPETLRFSNPQMNASSGTYEGGGATKVIDNFIITSKKFNYMDMGRKIKMGWIDILMSTTEDGEVNIQVREDYSPDVINQQDGDLFFNTTIPTSSLNINDGSTKNFHRVFCNSRGSFLTLTFTFSDEQMNSSPAVSNVRIDGIVIWTRPADKELATGAL